MFRFFELLVDPYAPYPAKATPPDRLWPFLGDYLQPARRVMAWTIVVGLSRSRSSRSG